MRTIFFFFLALNLIIFFWPSGSGDKKGSAAIGNLPAGVKKLVLVGEVEVGNLEKSTDIQLNKASNKDNKTTASSTTSKPKNTSAKGAVCYSLGPFEAETQVKSISVKLQDLGATTHDRMEKSRSPIGYWLYLPPYKSWNEARRKVMELEQQGMADVFIMGRGRMKNAVSLGLFKDKKAADKRISELKKVGVKAKSETQYSDTEKYWIDVDVESGKSHVVSAIEAIAKGLTVLDLVPRKCN
jgi:hypothetical protein